MQNAPIPTENPLKQSAATNLNNDGLWMDSWSSYNSPTGVVEPGSGHPLPQKQFNHNDTYLKCCK